MQTEPRRPSCMRTVHVDHDHQHHHHQDRLHPPVASGAVRDPVCGMTVVPGAANGGTASHQGRDYWFCNPRCREKFVADPASCVAAAPAERATTSGAIYTCPMHPDVRQDHPGDCPKCGMALEPVEPAFERV